MGPTMQTHHLQIDQLNHLNQVQRFRAHQNHQEIHRLSPIRMHPSNVRSKTLEHDAGNQHQHLFDGLQGKDDENNGVHDLSQTHVSVSQGNIFSENEEDEILDQQDEDEDDDEENIEREKDASKYKLVLYLLILISDSISNDSPSFIPKFSISSSHDYKSTSFAYACSNAHENGSNLHSSRNFRYVIHS